MFSPEDTQKVQNWLFPKLGEGKKPLHLGEDSVSELDAGVFPFTSPDNECVLGTGMHSTQCWLIGLID